MNNSTKVNRDQLIAQILSRPNNSLKKTNLKAMKKEQLESILRSPTEVVQVTNAIVETASETKPKKTREKKERKILEFSDDDETNYEITAPEVRPAEETSPVKAEEPKTEQNHPLLQVVIPVEKEKEPTAIKHPRSGVRMTEKPVLKGNKLQKPEKPKKQNLDDIKDEIKSLIQEFGKLMTSDIRLFNSGEFTEDELINSHNHLREEIQDEIAILTSTLKVTPAFEAWFEKLLDIIRSKVERAIGDS